MRHSFCFSCITTHLGNRNNCPSCSQYLTVDQLLPNIILTKVMKKAAVSKIIRNVSPAEHLRLALEQGMDLNIKEIDSLLLLLSERKQELEQEEAESNMEVLLGFLQRSLLRKQVELHEGIIGRGSIGTVYKATRSDGITIAVKKLKSLKRKRDSEEFEADMRGMENLRHQNLVELQGYYLSTTLKLILSEFIPNGTLFFHLHYRNPTTAVMTWTQRFNIGLGIARGLDHLHSKHCPPIMHFNLTSANVLLDDRFEAKISDYGLRKFLPIHNKYISSRLYYETLAYMAPELACGSLRVSEKCDVYNFGVVLLELVTGQKPSEEVHGATVLIGDYVKSKLEQQRIWECIDPQLFTYNAHQIGSAIKLALKCTSQEPSTRPTMAEAVQILESLEGSSSASEHVQIDNSEAETQCR